MNIYISGKISGMEEEARTIFDRAEQEIISMGHHPINPMKLPADHDKSWYSYMKADIKVLMDCEGIYMIGNWAESPGAIIEHTLALQLGMTIWYETLLRKQKQIYNQLHFLSLN